MSRFIDQFEVILLDMMGTFIFDGDRFSANEDFAATYRKLGGNVLDVAQVNSAINEVFRRMSADYDSPALYECFPAVNFYLEQFFFKKGWPISEVGLLDDVFAMHESGSIAPDDIEVLGRLAQTHRLGVVSNLWCKSTLMKDEFKRAGMAELFETVVFSSDYGINKPSPLLYWKALDQLGVDANRAVFVGDSLRYDVAGAKAAGMATVWINSGGESSDVNGVRPDKLISHLRELT